MSAPFLRKLAFTRDKHKRLRVLRAYARLRTPLAEKILFESLSDPCELIRDFLVKELSTREISGIEPVFRRLVQPPWYAKSAALKILGNRKVAEAVALIGRVSADPNADVRKSAAEALTEIGGKEALGFLVTLAKDNNPYVRTAAEEGLRKISDIRFV